jgi:hypothetical protein
MEHTLQSEDHCSQSQLAATGRRSLIEREWPQTLWWLMKQQIAPVQLPVAF